jgi:stage V sporulation protein B
MFLARRPVLKNIVILACSGVCERFLGALYRVVLARAAGAEALGLIQFCLPLHRLGLILCTLGLPQALTRLIAEAVARGGEDHARSAFRWSLRTSSLLAGGLAVLLMFGFPLGRLIFPDPRVAPLLRWLGPILFCDCVGLILQANFQGRNKMWPLALAGILGQGSKLAITIVLIGRAGSKSISAIAAAALAGMAASEAASMALLAALTGRSATTRTVPARRPLLLASFPLMGDALVFAVAGMADVLVVPRRLAQAGLPLDHVTALMGQVWGMAIPVLFLPMVAIWPIAAATLPVITAAVARGDRRELRRRVFFTYAAVGAVALGAALLFHAFPVPIVKLLYARPDAAPYLRALAWAVVPIYLASISGTLLIGLGKPMLLFWQSAACAALRTFLLYILTGMPSMGVFGAIAAIAVGNAVLAVANGWGIIKEMNSPPTEVFNKI